MNENIGITLILTFALGLCLLIAGAIVITVQADNDAMSKMVAAGATPQEAHCAVKRSATNPCIVVEKSK